MNSSSMITGLNRRIVWFEAKMKWGSTPVNLALSGSGTDVLAEALATAHALWDAQEACHQSIVAHAVERLLPVKNGNWLKDGEAPLTAADFAARMRLTDITILRVGPSNSGSMTAICSAIIRSASAATYRTARRKAILKAEGSP